VRVTTRLVDSPACLVVTEGDMSMQLARLLKQAGQKAPEVKPVTVDDKTTALIVRPIEVFSRAVLWKGVDVAAVDGAVDLLGHRFRGIGAIFRQMQSGSIRNYATWVMLGSLLVLIVLGLAGGAR